MLMCWSGVMKWGGRGEFTETTRENKHPDRCEQGSPVVCCLWTRERGGTTVFSPVSLLSWRLSLFLNQRRIKKRGGQRFSCLPANPSRSSSFFELQGMMGGGRAFPPCPPLVPRWRTVSLEDVFPVLSRPFAPFTPGVFPSPRAIP